MNASDYERMAEQMAGRIIANSQGNDAYVRSQLAEVIGKANSGGNETERLYYWAKIASILQQHLGRNTPVIIEHNGGQQRSGSFGSEELYTRLRRLRGMFAIRQLNHHPSPSYTGVILAEVAAAVVLGGLVSLPLFAVLLGMGVAGRWMAQRQGMSRRACFLAGVLPALPALLGSWWVAVAAIAIHYWWRETTVQSETHTAENHNDGDHDGPPQDA